MVWKASHHTSQSEQANEQTYSRKLMNFSDSHSRNVNSFGLCHWDYCTFGLRHFNGHREHRIWRCSSHIPPTNHIWLLVVWSSQETFQGQSIHMWWRSSSCYGKMVLRIAWRFLQQQVWEMSSALAALYWTRSRLHREMKYGNKVHIPSYTSLFVSFWHLVWV